MNESTIAPSNTPSIDPSREDHHRQHEDRERELELICVDRVQVGAQEDARHAAERGAGAVSGSFDLTSGTPIDAAATSSSRSAIRRARAASRATGS